jgi:hypothetical protein
MDILRKLIGERYDLLFPKKVAHKPKEKIEEDILRVWSMRNPKLKDLIDEFELEL